MRVTLSHRVDGVAPTAAFAWWSDFRDGRSDHSFMPGVSRRVVERDAGRVVMEDRGPLWRERTTAWLEPGRVRFEGDNTFARFLGEYRFEEDGSGTRIALEADVDLKGVYGAGRLLVRPLLIADLRGHAREMRRDLAAA